MRWLKPHIRNFLIVAGVFVGIRYTQEFQDWSKLLNYQPPQQIARLATNTTMTETGRRLFYVNQPQVETRKSSLNLCKSSEHTVILGCYVVGKGIFIQSVPDPRLEGVMEVTAAHEMLHVAYQRMSIVEQNQLNKLLQSALQQLKNRRIQELVQTYRNQDPHSVNTELHSILGTEVRHLSPELETHYRKYFQERSKIVALSERYEGVFTSLRERAKTLNQELVQRKSTMEQLAHQVDSEAATVETERLNLQGAIAVHPHDDYSIRVSTFNDRVRNYNQLVTQLRQQTDSYNQLVNQHNSIALEEKSLVESLENK